MTPAFAPASRPGGMLGLLVLATATLACHAAPPDGSAPGTDPPHRPELARRGPSSPTEALRGDTLDGFARALGPRPFVFPRDHGPHPAFATEWWYFTGNLESAAGDHYGYQLTFFRKALAPPGTSLPTGSSWTSRQLFLAHFALTDAAGRRFYAAERFGREGLGLAGAVAGEGTPFRVWLDDWQATTDPELPSPPDPDQLTPLRLRARDRHAGEHFAIDLVLTTGKPTVLHGDAGWSRKGTSPGNASYYYTRPRMPTRGTLRLGERTVSVTGASWLDREWSTSLLEASQVGWDWFGLQLDDGRELMAFRLREDSGQVSSASHGTLIEADGTTRHLTRDDVVLTVLDSWTNRRGVTYPAGWRLEVPEHELALEISPWLADQELVLGFRYWEGAVRIRGKAGERAVGGNGYVELVGYDDGETRSSSRPPQTR